ncbi:hypothetical protein ACBJ59_18745 [Nonomuraea sp. MTCD27]|uniref:hypothetical protein n=1 Tax=Nonomuraea sp. MTCD27 TaxID=1676747 RepID=UPI0035C14750
MSSTICFAGQAVDEVAGADLRLGHGVDVGDHAVDESRVPEVDHRRDDADGGGARLSGGGREQRTSMASQEPGKDLLATPASSCDKPGILHIR